MSYRYDLDQHRWVFADLRELLSKSSPARSGDVLAGLAADSCIERMAARLCLADVPLRRFLDEAVIPYESDEVTRLIFDSHDAQAFAPIAHLTVGAFRDWLLAHSTDTNALTSVASGLTPEMVAAVSKLMRNQDLVLVARKCRVITRFRNTIGLPGHLAVRLQTTHPTDDARGLTASIVDGLLYGVGDAVIGVNPATDNLAALIGLVTLLDDVITDLQLPTQSCVLTHATNTLRMIERSAPVDLVFQSIAGTEAANTHLGIDLALLDAVHAAALSAGRGTLGDNVMYFETGQGSALSVNAHHGVDQQTCEARAYAVARRYRPLLTNTMIGSIGPEYLYDSKQIIRAGLEDHFCGKLLGLPLGCDVCYTHHAEVDSDDMDTLMTMLGVAGLTSIMGVPSVDDVAPSYQSTSCHDALYLRELLGLKRAPEFEQWLQTANLRDAQGRLLPVEPTHPMLQTMRQLAIR